MLFLSNKKLKLLIIALLLTIFAFFLGLLSPKAEVYTFPIRTDTAAIGDSFSYTTLITNSVEDYHGPVNQDGYVLFTMNSIVGSNGSTPGDRPLNEVLLQYRSSSTTISETYICEFGTTSSWTDNNKITQSYSVKCPIPKGAHFNSIALGYNRTSYTHLTVDFSDIGSFVSSSDNNELNQIITILQQMQTQGSQQVLNQIQNNTNNINNSINDSNVDNSSASSSASSWNSKNTTNGTITNLLTLPITLLQAIVNGIQTTCSTFNLGTLFNTSLTLPCINLSSLIGSELFTVIDLLISGFMILAIGKKLVKIFNDFTNLRSNQVDELYGGGK